MRKKPTPPLNHRDNGAVSGLFRAAKYQNLEKRLERGRERARLKDWRMFTRCSRSQKDPHTQMPDKRWEWFL